MMDYRLNGVNDIGRNGHLAQGGKRAHYVFLVDNSASMDLHDISRSFSSVHADLLDTLAEDDPTAVTTLLTYCSKLDKTTKTFGNVVDVLYKGAPITDAMCLDMHPEVGNDIGHAIVFGLHPLLTPQLLDEDAVTVIVVNDGDVETEIPYATVIKTMEGFRSEGVKFLYLVANRPIETARRYAEYIGFHPDEVMVWEHSAKGLSRVFEKVGDILTLGSATATNSQETQLVALPPHRPL